MQCNDWTILSETSEYLQRYVMLSKFNIYSYGNVYDKLPAKWIDVLAIIDNAVNGATEKRKSLDG